MKSILYLTEKKARLVINDLGCYEVHRATKCSNCDMYFWETVGVHKSTNLGLQKALTQYYMTIVYAIDKGIFYESMRLQS